MIGKFHDPVQLKLEAIRVQQPKTLLITSDQLPENKTKMVITLVPMTLQIKSTPCRKLEK